ncbi:MAG: glycosyltransferase [Candidatus Lutacidiplasmatales archaeon]
MRVLIVSRGSYRLPVSQGGTDAYALRTATYLIPQGHEVYLVGQGRPGPAFGEVRFVRVPTDVQVTSRFRATYFFKGLVLSLASVLTAVKLLRRRDASIDVIHCNSNLAVLILKRLYPSSPMVYTLHDPLIQGRSTSWLDRLVRPLNNGLLERWALRRADHIIAVSSEIRAQVEQVLGPSSKLTLLYPLSRGHAPRRSASSPTAGQEGQTPYVLSIGAQAGRKRFDLLIRALARTKFAVRLVLVGSGPDRPRLVRTAEECGVADRVVFHSGISEGEIADLYRGALVYAMASEREGFPVTLMEAVLSGTPALYFTDAETGDLDGFQSDFFRVIRSLGDEEIARDLDLACSQGLRRPVDRGHIAQWAQSLFRSPESVAHELVRIYQDAADQLGRSIRPVGEGSEASLTGGRTGAGWSDEIPGARVVGDPTRPS